MDTLFSLVVSVGNGITGALGRVYYVAKRSHLLWLGPLGVGVVVVKASYNFAVGGLTTMLAAFGEISVIASDLGGNGLSVGDLLAFANRIAPVEEFFSVNVALLHFAVAMLTVRVIKAFIPKWIF